MTSVLDVLKQRITELEAENAQVRQEHVELLERIIKLEQARDYARDT